MNRVIRKQTMRHAALLTASQVQAKCRDEPNVTRAKKVCLPKVLTAPGKRGAAIAATEQRAG
jgi:hypothetical protein